MKDYYSVTGTITLDVNIKTHFDSVFYDNNPVHDHFHFKRTESQSKVKDFINEMIVNGISPTHGDIIIVDVGLEYPVELVIYRRRCSKFYKEGKVIIHLWYELLIGDTLPNHLSYTEHYDYSLSDDEGCSFHDMYYELKKLYKGAKALEERLKEKAERS